MKRVASGVGEGATAITMVHHILSEVPEEFKIEDALREGLAVPAG